MNIDKAQPMNPQVEQIKLMNVANPNDKPALFAVNCCHCGGRPKVFMQISNHALMEVSQDGLNCDTIGRQNNQRLLLHCSCSAQPAPTPEAVMDGYETLFDAVDAWNRENMPTEKLKDIHKLLESLDGELSMGVDGTIFLGRNIAGHAIRQPVGKLTYDVAGAVIAMPSTLVNLLRYVVILNQKAARTAQALCAAKYALETKYRDYNSLQCDLSNVLKENARLVEEKVQLQQRIKELEYECHKAQKAEDLRDALFVARASGLDTSRELVETEGDSECAEM